ncbi:dCTP deaminase, partial [Campylobacter coli]|nr:dCTP deaminase [Campylobacter coli]
MGLKADNWIRKMALEHKMIEPFCEANIGKGVVSYGLSSYGYDIRVGREFKIFTNVNSTVVDPKNFLEENVVDFEGDVCIVPANSFALARTIEYFKMPNDVLAICLGKSTYARCGIIVNVT